MKMRTLGHTIASGILTIVAVSAGCQQKATTATPPTAVAPASLGPEESFEAIVASFKEGVEDVDIGFFVPDRAGGHSRMDGTNQVSYELIKPEKEGGQYKGIISVRSEAHYSVQRSTEAKEPEEQTEEDSEGGLADEDSDTEVFDPALVTTPDPNRSAATKLGKNEVLIAREENTTDRKYELVYENGRWVLTTKLNPKTERAIQNAFERALESQS